METNISQLSLAGLEIRLTNERLYLKTFTSQETFALRSVNGIGVIDLVEDYNRDLIEYNKKKSEANKAKLLLVSGAVSGVIMFYLAGVFGLVASALIIVAGLIALNKVGEFEPPVLRSAVRIMLSGTFRDFQFLKSNSSAIEVANFVAQVENTLSAYQRN